MRFIMMAKADAAYEAGSPPDPKLMELIGELGAEAVRAGKLVFQAGLQPTRAGWRMGLAKGKTYAVDGPFAETKEVIGGFAILEAGSTKEAIELTKRFLRVHGDEWDIECEVRQLDGPEFGREA